MGVVNKVLDIAGRPLNGVINYADNLIDRGSDSVKQMQEGESVNSVGSALAGILGIDKEGAAVPFDTIGKGIFSTDEKYRKFGSDLIENATDNIGSKFDEDYVDTKDNVNPILKGVAGFATDIVGDPLTWIPGGLIIKGAKGVGELTKGAAQTVKNAPAILKGERAATQAVKESDEVADVARASNAEGVAKAVEEEPNVLDMVETFRAPSQSSPAPALGAMGAREGAERSIADDLLGGTNPAAELQDAVTLSSWRNVPRETPTPVAAVAEVASDVPTPASITSDVRPAEAAVTPSAAEAPPVAAPAAALPEAPVAAVEPTLQEAFESHPRRQQILQELSKIESLVGTGGAPQSSSQWLRSVASKPISGNWAALGFSKKPTYGAVAQAMQNAKQTGNMGRAQALHQFLQESYLTSAQAGGRKIEDLREAFQLRAMADSDTMLNVLGGKLFDTLSSKNSAASFARSFNAISKALDPTQNLAHFTESNKAVIGALRDTLQIPSHIKPRAATEAEIRAAGRTIEDNEAVRDAIAAVAREADPISAESFARYPVREGMVGYTNADVLSRDAKHLDVLGTFDQLTIYKKIMQSVKDSQLWINGGETAYGLRGAETYRQALLAHLDSVTDVMNTLGTPVKLGVRGEELLPITHAEVLRSVEAVMDSEDAVRALYLYGSSAAPTAVLNAAHKALTEGADFDKILGILTDKKYGRKGARGEDLPNWINSPKTFHSQFTAKQSAAAEKLAKGLPGGAVSKTPGGALRVTFNGHALAERLAQGIVDATPAMAQRVATNADALNARVVDEASSISNEVVDAVRKAVDDEAPDSMIVEAVHNVPDDAAEIGTGMAATQEAVALATTVAEGAMGNPLVRISDIAESTSRKLTNPMVSQAKAINEGSKQMTDEAIEELSEGLQHIDDLPDSSFFDAIDEVAGDLDDLSDIAKPKTPYRDLGSMDDADVFQQATSRLLDPFRKAFNARFGQERLFDLHRAGQSVANLMLHTTSEKLAALSRKYPATKGGDDLLRESFAALQRGDVPEHLTESANDIEAVLKDFLATGDGKSYLDVPMLRADGDVTNLNDALETAFGSYVQKPNFDLDAAKEVAGEGARSREVIEAMKDQWRDWKVEDPLDFINRLASATATVAERKATANSFMHKFEKAGLAGKTPFEGSVKITDLSGKSTIRRYLPSDYYVDKNLAGELHRMDQVLRTSSTIDIPAIQKYYMPVQNAWKRGMTILRPGHHIRNFIGDSSITWMARGNYAYGRSLKDAVKILGFRGNYNGVDINRVLNSMYEGENLLPTGGEIIARGKVSGKEVELNAEAIRDAMMKRGLLSTHKVAEDLYDDAVSKSKLQGVLDKATLQDPNMGALSKVGETAADVSMFTSHVGRGQHFVQYIHQALAGKQGLKGFKSVEDLFDKAADEVLRAHPDGSLLSTFERKYLRVIVPFYSWFSKTLPFAIEATLRHPGRFTVFPKASYNLAVSMGIDPNSLAEPFPSDQLFPSYITEGFYGPQFQIGDKYVGFNPGIAVTDIFKDIGNDPVRGIAGMVSPLLRGPAELLSGSSWSTGAPISDTSDYLDSSIPGVNNVANVTGVSPTGSVASLLTGQGLDQQRQVARGNKDDFDKLLTSLNWLTGMQFQNMSRPNMINQAEIEARNRAGGNG